MRRSVVHKSGALGLSLYGNILVAIATLNVSISAPKKHVSNLCKYIHRYIVGYRSIVCPELFSKFRVCKIW